MITLTLPLPPSVNHSKVRGRWNRQHATAWKTEAGWAIRRQMMALGNPPPFACRVAVSILFIDRGDIDNRLKPLLDLLQLHRVYENDKLVKRLLVEMYATRDCTVTITPIDGKS